MTVRIRVYENSAHMDEEAAYTLRDEFAPAEALARCREMVASDLAEVFQPGISAEALLRAYRMFGSDPVILGGEAPPFSAWTYAEALAAEMVDTIAKNSDSG